MKAHRNLVYICILMVASSFIAYSFIFWCYSSADNSSVGCSAFFNNIFLGILGSSIVSLIIELGIYFDAKSRYIEQFMNAYVAILNHTANFPSEASGCKDWFTVYREKLFDLRNVVREIGFILDIKGRKKYTQDVLTYCNDYYLLSQQDFHLVGINPMKKIYEKIKSYTMLTDDGTYYENKLNSDLGAELNNMNNLFIGKNVFASYKFSKSFVTNKVFRVLSADAESVVKTINSIIKNTSSYDVNIEISEDIYQELYDCQCVDAKTTTMDDKIIGVRCTHIINEYFDIKSRYVG